MVLDPVLVTVDAPRTAKLCAVNNNVLASAAGGPESKTASETTKPIPAGMRASGVSIHLSSLLSFFSIRIAAGLMLNKHASYALLFQFIFAHRNQINLVWVRLCISFSRHTVYLIVFLHLLLPGELFWADCHEIVLVLWILKRLPTSS